MGLILSPTGKGSGQRLPRASPTGERERIPAACVLSPLLGEREQIAPLPIPRERGPEGESAGGCLAAYGALCYTLKRKSNKRTLAIPRTAVRKRTLVVRMKISEMCSTLAYRAPGATDQASNDLSSLPSGDCDIYARFRPCAE